jgi:hypothetical protein
MKKCYLVILAILPNFIFAQLEIDTDWKTDINNIFQHLDKSKVSSGHLLDYAPASNEGGTTERNAF